MTLLSRGLHGLQSAFYHDRLLRLSKKNRQLARVVTTASREKLLFFQEARVHVTMASN